MRGETLVRSERLLRDGGRLVTLVGSVPVGICAAGRIVCPATPPCVGLKDGRYTQRPASVYTAQSATGRAPADEALRRRWIRSISVTDGWRIVVKAYEASTPAR